MKASADPLRLRLAARVASRCNSAMRGHAGASHAGNVNKITPSLAAEGHLSTLSYFHHRWSGRLSALRSAASVSRRDDKRRLDAGTCSKNLSQPICGESPSSGAQSWWWAQSCASSEIRNDPTPPYLLFGASFFAAYFFAAGQAHEIGPIFQQVSRPAHRQTSRQCQPRCSAQGSH